MWKNMINKFGERERHYKQLYLEKCLVMDEALELQLYSSSIESWEIYINLGRIQGIVYIDEAEAEELFDKIKDEIEREYISSNKNISREYEQQFMEKFNLKVPFDLFF